MQNSAALQEVEEINYPIVNTSELEYCKLMASYEADPDEVNEKINEAVEQLRKLAVPGFRPGKAPDYAIRARCEKRINDWVAREMAGDAFDAVLFETGVRSLGMPEFKSISCKKGRFKCEMVVTHKPDFELVDFNDLSVEMSDAIDDNLQKQVEEGIMAIRLRAGEVHPYEDDDAVKIGDDITMTYNATINGEPYDGGLVEGDYYTVGANKYPGFDDHIIGMKAGESREFELVIDDEDTVKFEVTVHMGTTKKPAELDESFFEMVGAKSLEDLESQITSIVKAQNKQSQMDNVRRQITQQLVDKHEFDVPEFLTETEAKYLRSQIRNRDINDDIIEKIRVQAEKNCKLSLILDSVREEEPDSVMTDGEAEMRIMQRFQMQGQDPGKSLVEARRNGSLTTMLVALKDEFTLQWIIDQVLNKKEENNGEEEIDGS